MTHLRICIALLKIHKMKKINRKINERKRAEISQ